VGNRSGDEAQQLDVEWRLTVDPSSGRDPARTLRAGSAGAIATDPRLDAWFPRVDGSLAGYALAAEQVTPSDAPARSATAGGTTKTGHRARAIKSVETLPSSAARARLRPRDPQTSRSSPPPACASCAPASPASAVQR